jgi:peptidoglycan/LPS O-acetylase OafA/YrhL
MTTTAPRHYGNIDYIRAFASLIVVAAHYGAIPYPQSVGPFALVFGYACRLVVPLFMVVSSFLFARSERTGQYAWSKIKRMLLLALVWSFIFYLCNGGFPAYIGKISEIAKAGAREPLLLAYYLASGLQTVFYFFVALALIQLLVFLLQRASTGVVVIVLAACLLVLLILPFVLDGKLAVFDNPINFLAFAPVGVLLNRRIDDVLGKKLLVGGSIFGLGIAAMALEAFVLHPGDLAFINGGTKASLVFLATGLFVMTTTERRPGRIIRFMSDQSLLLYFLHTCVFSIVATTYDLVFTKGLRLAAAWAPAVQFLIALMLCYMIGVLVVPRIMSQKTYST